MKQFEYKLNKEEELFYVMREQYQQVNSINIKKDGKTNRRERRKQKRK